MKDIKELHYIDCANYLLNAKKSYEELYPKTKHGATNKQTKKNNLERPTAFIHLAALEINKSETNIKELLQIARKIIPEVKKIIKEKNIPVSAALEIATMDKESQEMLLESFEKTGELPIYIVYLVSDQGKRLKIGKTVCLKQRLRQISNEIKLYTDKPAVCVSQIVCSSEEEMGKIEGQILQKFIKHRVTREWFVDDQEIRDFFV